MFLALTTASASIISACIIAVGAVAVGYLQHRTSHKIDAVHNALKTNHGKTPGDYLEMIEGVAKETSKQGKRVEMLAIAFSDHILANEVNFQELRANQWRIERRLEGERREPPWAGE